MSHVGTPEDAELLARIEAGDDRALAEIYARHAGVVLGVAQRVTRDPELARDVCQEVFSYLWELPGRVDLTKASLRGFLAMVAHRRAVDEVRRSEARRRAHAALDQPGSEAGPDEEVTDAAAAMWRDARLASVVDQLPPELCEPLRLAYFHGLSYRRVAEALGIPEGTAKSRLRLALARLRESLGPEFRTAI